MAKEVLCQIANEHIPCSFFAHWTVILLRVDQVAIPCPCILTFVPATARRSINKPAAHQRLWQHPRLRFLFLRRAAARGGGEEAARRWCVWSHANRSALESGLQPGCMGVARLSHSHGPANTHKHTHVKTRQTHSRAGMTMSGGITREVAKSAR